MIEAKTLHRPQISHKDDDLSENQIEELLARATERLREKSTSQLSRKNELHPRYTFPKLNTGVLPEPYLSSNGTVTTVESGRLLDKKQRKQADGVREVKDPLVVKQMANEVRHARRSYPAQQRPINEENSSQFHSSRARAPSWLTLLRYERFIIIS